MHRLFVFANQEGSFNVLSSQGGSLVCFENQEGTLAHVFPTIGPQGGATPTMHTINSEYTDGFVLHSLLV